MFSQPGYLSDDDCDRVGQPGIGNHCCDVREIAGHRALILSGAESNHGNGPFGRHAVGDQVFGDRWKGGKAHEKYDGALKPGDCLIVDLCGFLGWIFTAGDHRERCRDSSVGDGNAGVGCRSNRRRYARYDLPRDAVGREGKGLLAASTEHERVSPFESTDILALFGEFYDEGGDLWLAHCRCAGRLANVDQLRIQARVVE